MIFKRFPKFIAALALMFAAGYAAAQATPDAMIKTVAEDVRAIIKQDKDLQAGDANKIYALIEEKVFPSLNFAKTTRLAVGKSWTQASPEQRDALVKEFRSLLVRTYATSLRQFRDQQIEYKPLTLAAADTDVLVRTNVIQGGQQPVGVDYRVEKGADGWKVYDIIIDGVSLVTTYRGEFTERVRQGGIDGLIKALSEKNRAGRG
jgi:phospholipid transport system substrate-binding protein